MWMWGWRSCAACGGNGGVGGGGEVTTLAATACNGDCAVWVLTTISDLPVWCKGATAAAALYCAT